MESLKFSKWKPAIKWAVVILAASVVIVIGYYLIMILSQQAEMETLEYGEEEINDEIWRPGEPEKEVEQLPKEQQIKERVEEVQTELRFKITYFPETIGTDLYSGYEYSVTQEALDKIDDLRERNGEVINYPVYEILRTNDFTSGIEKFAEAISAPEYTIFYNSLEDSISLELTEPLVIPGIAINPYIEENVVNLLQYIVRKYFALDDLMFQVERISPEGNMIRVMFCRLEEKDGLFLKHYPYHDIYFMKNDKSEWSLVTGTISLVQLREVSAVPIISASELSNSLNSPLYGKAVVLLMSDDLLYSFNEGEYLSTGRERAQITIKDFEIGLFIKKIDREIRAPILIAEADGTIEIGNQDYSIDYRVLLNGISSENTSW